MRYRSLILVVLFGVQLASAEPTNNTLGVMTYNLRYASQTGANAWPTRRPLVKRVIESAAPDLIGTQEGLLAQLEELASDLPEYRWVGVGRDDGKLKGEFMAVFYRKSRLEPLSTNYFWLSDTPEVAGSTTWGNTYPRMVTELKFRDRKTHQEFWLLNTHFDHQVQLAREKSAQLVRQRLSGLKPKLPVILLGDFNAGAIQNKAYEILTEGDFLTDAWRGAAERRGEGVGTFNDFKAAVPNGPRIDWILTRGDFAAKKAEIITYSAAGQFPSDHFPVVVWLELGANPQP